MVVEAPGQPSKWSCGGPPYPRILKIKGNKTYVEAPWLWRPLGNGPACPVINPALITSINLFGKR